MLIADRRALFPILLVLATAAGACRSQPAASAPVPADVWAVVDGRQIRRDDVEKAYRRTMQPNPVMSEDETAASKLNPLDQMLTQDILLARGNELKIVIPDAELETAFNEEQKNIPDETLNKELAVRNLTAADMRDALRRDLIARKVVGQEVTSKIKITGQEINDFFQANKAQFNLAEDAYRIAQIVVTPVRDQTLNNRTGDDATTVQEATAKVQMLMERLKSGRPFDEVAMDYSEDPQPPQGGDVASSSGVARAAVLCDAVRAAARQLSRQRRRAHDRRAWRSRAPASATSACPCTKASKMLKGRREQSCGGSQHDPATRPW